MTSFRHPYVSIMVLDQRAENHIVNILSRSFDTRGQEAQPSSPGKISDPFLLGEREDHDGYHRLVLSFWILI